MSQDYQKLMVKGFKLASTFFSDLSKLFEQAENSAGGAKHKSKEEEKAVHKETIAAVKEAAPSSQPTKQSEKKTRKAKKPKKNADPELDAIKKPLSAYMIYAQEQSRVIRAESPELKITEISKQVGANWSKLSEDGKAKYAKKAAERKIEYQLKV